MDDPLTQTFVAMHRELSALLRARGADAALAEDIAQDAILRAIEKQALLHDPARAAAWIKRIAVNLWLDHVRQDARRPDAPAVAADLDPDLTSAAVDDDRESEALNRSVGGWLRSALDELPAPYREAVHRVDVLGQRQSELAADLGLSASGAKSRVQRGRAMLREALRGCCDVDRDRRGNVLAARAPSGCC